AGTGNGLVFKLVPFYFAKESGAANGIVSMMGGLGGFFPPIVISYVTMMTGTSHLAFIFLAFFGVIGIITMLHIVKKDNLRLIS
ncbi:MFS transporter, partial [Mammaliicoccus fleurettii]